MRVADLYGLKTGNFEKIRKQLERFLRITFIARESEYDGNYYSLDFKQGDELIFQTNYCFVNENQEEEWSEPDFKEFNIIGLVIKFGLVCLYYKAQKHP